MIVAGIDEAGYGPMLGPLVVGCSAFELAPDPAADEPGELPCLWRRLRKLVSRSRSKTGRKLHINDSKLVYAPAEGLKELERSVVSMAIAGGGAAGSLDAFLHTVAADAMADLANYAWYQPCPEERFPLEQEGVAVAMFANALRVEMERSAVRPVCLAARVVAEREFNRIVNNTRNKGSALFSTGAIHIDHLIRRFGQQDLTIFCDRQGGREHYGPLLRLMWPDWSLEIVREDDGDCDYRLHQAGHTVRILFAEKAEVKCLPVALASMLAKYVREALMHRFNRYWKAHVPELVPTAGYYGDAGRFLDQIAAKRVELGVTDELLVRCR